MSVDAEEDQADTAEGIVISTDPRAGTAAERGDTISVTVASGMYTVPNVEGQDVDTATATLEGLGFEVDTTTTTTSDESPGTVVSQDRAADSRIDIGSTVTLSVAAEGTVTVPNVTGRSREDAEGVLQGEGFGTTVEFEASDSVDEGS